MSRYGRDYGGRHGYNPQHGFGPGLGRGGGGGGYRGYGSDYEPGHNEGGWGMEGLYEHLRHGEPWRNRGGNPYLQDRGGRERPYRGGARGGYGDVYRSYGRGSEWRARGWGGLYNPRNNDEYRGFTGMESNRQRGVYGSDFRVLRGGYDAGYTSGRRGWYGEGMNPGRHGPYDGDLY